MSPGRFMDQLVEYARDASAAEFARNLGRDIRKYPLPLTLLGAGFAWLMVKSAKPAQVESTREFAEGAKEMTDRAAAGVQDKIAGLSERVSDAAAPQRTDMTVEKTKEWDSWGSARRIPLWGLALIAAIVGLGLRHRPSSPGTAGTPEAETDRGRTAATPSEIPPRGWTDILWRVYNGISEHRVLAIAAGITFYSLLAIFPAIAALVALYSLFADPGTIRSHLDSLSSLLPGGAIAIIGDQITRVSAQGSTKLGFASLAGLAVSLWSANAGIKALFDALNVVYQEREKRGFFALNTVSLSFTLAGILLVLIAIAVMIALPPAMAFLNFGSATEWVISVLRWPLLFIVVSLAISVIYRYGPSREKARWRWLSWGRVFAAFAWLAMSLLFSWYAKNFGRFNETYGSLGAAIGFMTWMWLSSVVLLIGAELNAEIEHQTLVDTTTGEPQPMGSRNAVMADTAGQTRMRNRPL